MKVVMISGKAGHGKTTLASFLEEELAAQGKEVLVGSFGTAVKDALRNYYDWDGKKDAAGRSLLQLVGTDIVRAKDEHYWTDTLMRLAVAMNPDYLIVDDWRFVEEVERSSEYCDDIITIKVERYEKWVGDHPDDVNIPYKNPAMTAEQLSHRSEMELEKCVCEYKITNVSLNELRESAKKLSFLI